MTLRRWPARKPAGPTARARAAKRRKLSAAEQAAKQQVHVRDGQCRFPRCGCNQGRRPLNGHAWLTVSHDRHKGIGGNPAGDRSTTALMILLCAWRHQEAPVSRHAGTMKTRYLTDAGNDGPVAFLVDLHALYPGLYDKPGVWLEVARERERGELEDELSAHQEQVLADLAEMDR